MLVKLLAKIIRGTCVLWLGITRQLKGLLERATYTEIGLTGHVSLADENMARERKLKPLNRFEKWLLKPVIQTEKNFRQSAWRQSVIEVTGEDPDPDAA